MTFAEAKSIAEGFTDAIGYRVQAQQRGVLVTESQEGRGRTSFFVDEHNFYRFIETVVARIHPISRR